MTTVPYPGNPSLPADMRHRVISTFRQSVELARNGKDDDSMLGCDFILKLDPLFDPAKRLLDYLQAPGSAVDFDALLGIVGETSDLLSEARRALDRREFELAAELAGEVLHDQMTNAEAQSIVATAQERMEAMPFIEHFLREARNQLSAGNPDGAAAEVAKATKLDSTHPAIAAMEKTIEEARSSVLGLDLGSSESPFADAFGSAQTAEEAPATTFSFDQFPEEEPASAGEDTASFVVDAPGRESSSGAVATDFGFNFEEEQDSSSIPGFTFEVPPEGPGSTAAGGGPSEPEVGEAHTFDFATASVDTTPEDEAKIAENLREGDAAFERGAFQEAIDIWSRIFLIDVTHEPATERIEKARLKRQAGERRGDELFAAGVEAFSRSDVATARARFEEVLANDPNRRDAAEYLERLASGGRAAATAQPAGSVLDDDFFMDDESEAFSSEEILIPPDEPAEAEAPSPKKPGKAQPKLPTPARAKSSRAPLVMALAFVVLLVGGWFGWQRFTSPAAHDPTEAEAVFAEAAALAGNGRFDDAINRLLTIPADDPERDQAIMLIDEYKEKRAQAAGTIDGRPASVVFAEHVASGRAAFEQRDFIAAKQSFEQAAAIQALPAEVKPMFAEATEQVGRLNEASALLRRGDWIGATDLLEPMHADDPANANVRELLSNAYFNSAVAALQREDTSTAAGHLDRVLRLFPEDQEARRTRELASRYDGREKDLRFRIYAKHLPLRK